MQFLGEVYKGGDFLLCYDDETEFYMMNVEDVDVKDTSGCGKGYTTCVGTLVQLSLYGEQMSDFMERVRGNEGVCNENFDEYFVNFWRAGNDLSYQCFKIQGDEEVYMMMSRMNRCEFKSEEGDQSLYMVEVKCLFKFETR